MKKTWLEEHTRGDAAADKITRYANISPGEINSLDILWINYDFIHATENNYTLFWKHMHWADVNNYRNDNCIIFMYALLRKMV